MVLELPQLELRYLALRVSHPGREASLAASLLSEGQRHPVLVFRDAGRPVLVDGYRRVRALKALARDTVLALDLECDEPEALLRAWRQSVGRRVEAIEEGWLLRELEQLHGLSRQELAVRMGRTPSWVSRRRALVSVLPEAVQRHLQQGAVCAHAAQKVLVPLARANAEDCVRFVEAIAKERLSSRHLAQWFRAWRSADGDVRKKLVAEPMLYLRTLWGLERRTELPKETPEGRVVATLGAAATACWKAKTTLERLMGEHPEVSAHATVHTGAGALRRSWKALETALEGLDAGQ